MASINEKLLDEVLALPTDLRSVLIEKLIESLNLPLRKEIDELWAEEAERRFQELEAGDVHSIPGEDVFRIIRKRNHK